MSLRNNPKWKRYARHSGIVTWCFLGTLLALQGCGILRHARHDARLLDTLTSTSPTLRAGRITLHCPHTSCDPSALIDVIETTASVVSQWLGEPAEPASICAIVLEPNDPMAHHWQREIDQNHGCTGRTYHDEGVLLLIGRASDKRFWSVLRHEVAHAVIHSLVGQRADALWFDEGVASLFETGVDQNLNPKPNSERLGVAQYLARTRRSLHISRLIQQNNRSLATGNTYARAWACVAYLHDHGLDPRGYLSAIQSGIAPKSAFETHMLQPGQTLDAFDQEVTAWIQQQNR